MTFKLQQADREARRFTGSEISSELKDIIPSHLMDPCLRQSLVVELAAVLLYRTKLPKLICLPPWNMDIRPMLCIIGWRVRETFGGRALFGIQQNPDYRRVLLIVIGAFKAIAQDPCTTIGDLFQLSRHLSVSFELFGDAHGPSYDDLKMLFKALHVTSFLGCDWREISSNFLPAALMSMRPTAVIEQAAYLS
jgi:hypothetical protein